MGVNFIIAQMLTLFFHAQKNISSNPWAHVISRMFWCLQLQSITALLIRQAYALDSCPSAVIHTDTSLTTSPPRQNCHDTTGQ